MRWSGREEPERGGGEKWGERGREEGRDKHSLQLEGNRNGRQGNLAVFIRNVPFLIRRTLRLMPNPKKIMGLN